MCCDLGSGLLIAVATMIGTLFGIMSRITGSMGIIAGILLLVAGRVAERIDEQTRCLPIIRG